MEVSVLKRTGRYAPCLICPLFHVFCTERCYFSFVPVVSLQRRARINYRLPLAFIVAQYLLLARYRARASMELSGPVLCTCTSVFVGPTGRIREQGFGDWRIGGPVTVERDGYMRFYESTGEGFVLFSCGALPRMSWIAEGYRNTFGSCQTAQNLSTFAWKPPISHAKHNFQTLHSNAYAMREDVGSSAEDRS